MEWDVVVAGSGPTGLMLAAELRLHGAEVLVIERLTEVDKTIKAGAVNLPTIEALRRRGLRDELTAYQDQMLAMMAKMHGEPAPSVAEVRQGMRKVGGHFGGLFKLDPSRLAQDDPDLAITDGHLIGVVPQAMLELILAAHAERLGVTLRRGVELTDVEQSDDGVTVHAGGDVLRARYLVGCDGGRSLVRKVAGFDFLGTEPTITGYQALVTIDHPELLPRGWNRTETGMLVSGPQPGRILTVGFDGPPPDRDAPVTREELEASLRAVSGLDVSITAVESATRFTDNARQASTYRIGRVLLAGDAAHVHSPFGGQGLNLGIGDAVNLGWKLAAVVAGRHGEDLLDTYTAERQPIAARVLEITRAQVALMRPDPLARALSGIVSELMDTHDGNAYFVKMISGVVQRYDLGSGHELVGRIAPLLALADGTTLADHCHEGGAVLFDLTGSGWLTGLAAGRVRVVETKPAGECPLTGLLVRPDGYVAWASADEGVDGLADALTRWC